MGSRVLFILTMVWLVAMLGGCTNGVTEQLERAEAYLPAEPDSAEMCLNSIEQEKLDDSQRAWFGLLSTIVSNHQSEGITTDSIIRPCYEYYRDDSHEGQTSNPELLRHYAQACYYMSVFYTNNDSTDQCHELLQQSIRCSEKSEDWHTCYLAHTLLSLTTSWDNPQDATRQAQKALDIYHKINDDISNEVLIMGHVAACFLDAEEPDSALAYYLKAYELAEKNQLKEAQNSICMGLSDTYCYMGAFWQALHYAKIGVETADSTTLVPSLISLAQCYYASDSLDKAKAVLDTIPCDSDDYINRYLTLRTLSEIAVQKRDVDSLYAYVDSAYEFLEDRFSREQQVKDAVVIQEKKQEEVRHETELHGWIIAFTLVFLLLVAGIVFYFYYVRKRMALQPATPEAKKQHLRQPLTPEVLQKRLLQRLESVHKHPSTPKLEKREERAWGELEKLINETDNDFVKKLRQQYPDFKDKDIQLCMLVRLKLTNAAIANVFNIGESAVKKRKSTLKKQGFHITDTDIIFEQIIEGLNL